MGEEDAILDFQERAARHMGLPDGVGDVLDLDTGQGLLTRRLAQAAADLFAAGAVDADGDAARMWITGAGRRLTEVEVTELPESGPAQEASPTKERPSVLDWIAAVLESWR